MPKLNVEKEGKNLVLRFPYNPKLVDEVRNLDGRRWDKTRKAWVVKDNQHNRFNIDYLNGIDVFAHFEKPLVPFSPRRGRFTEGGVCYTHQCDMDSFVVTRQTCELAAEMGTGKTLAAIEAEEYLSLKYPGSLSWYVGPKEAMRSVRMDFDKWGALSVPRFMTLHEMVKAVTNHKPGDPIPQRVWFDEASRLKSPDAKQAQAAAHLADGVRDHWGDEAHVVLMTGSPAPKSPMDWYMQCRIARPGFLKEGTPQAFKNRLALVVQQQGESGVAYPKVITFYDDPRKCKVCGQFADAPLHQEYMTRDPHFWEMTKKPNDPAHLIPHGFVKSVNEVEKLHRRMSGLVMVVLKKDCLDLPEKVYQRIDLEPTRYMKGLAKAVRKTAPSAAVALTLLRELSDGFQYHQERDEPEPCDPCGATGVKVFVDEEGEDQTETCKHCAGKRQFDKWKSVAVECDTPKDGALLDILSNKEEDGRLVVFAAFQGSVDRVCRLVVKAGWDYIRRDGRGWATSLDKTQVDCDPTALIRRFQDEKREGRLCIVGHPKSIGMGLTLTASDTEVYFSNSFDGEDRIQSEDRIHRPGCRGANIIDLIHLPVDALVLDNLKRKRDLQAITIGEIDAVLGD